MMAKVPVNPGQIWKEVHKDKIINVNTLTG